MALHHRAAAVDGFASGQFRIFFQDIGRHRIGEHLDNSGDDEKERPKKDENVHQEHSPHLVPVVLGRNLIGIAQNVVLAAGQQPDDPQPVGVRKRFTDQADLLQVHGITSH